LKTLTAKTLLYATDLDPSTKPKIDSNLKLAEQRITSSDLELITSHLEEVITQVEAEIYGDNLSQPFTTVDDFLKDLKR